MDQYISTAKVIFFLSVGTIAIPATVAGQTIEPSFDVKIELDETDLKDFQVDLPEFVDTRVTWEKVPTIPNFDPQGQTVPLEIVKEHIEIKIRNLCADPDLNKIDCASFRNISLKIDDAIDRLPRCSDAAKAYRENIYPRETALGSFQKQAIIRNFDIQCLASSASRPGTNGSVITPDIPPSIFIEGGGSSPNSGAFKATGFLSDNSGVFCGALLRPKNQLLTAKHCYELKSISYRKGDVYFTPTSQTNKKFAVKPTDDASLRNNDSGRSVGDDWIILDFEAENELPVPEVKFVDLKSATDVALIGHINSATLKTPLQEALSDKIDLSVALGIRWPRDGFCYAIEQFDACVKMYCQTVRGFSGSPVFLRSDTASDKPLEVVGIVSGAITDDSSKKECKASGIGMTAAVGLSHLEN